MPHHLPFGVDTLVVPFTWKARATRQRYAGMGRIRSAGELFRYGVVNSVTPQPHRRAKELLTGLGSRSDLAPIIDKVSKEHQPL